MSSHAFRTDCHHVKLRMQPAKSWLQSNHLSKKRKEKKRKKRKFWKCNQTESVFFCAIFCSIYHRAAGELCLVITGVYCCCCCCPQLSGQVLYCIHNRLAIYIQLFCSIGYLSTPNRMGIKKKSTLMTIIFGRRKENKNKKKKTVWSSLREFWCAIAVWALRFGQDIENTHAS